MTIDDTGIITNNAKINEVNVCDPDTVVMREFEQALITLKNNIRVKNQQGEEYRIPIHIGVKNLYENLSKNINVICMWPRATYCVHSILSYYYWYTVIKRGERYDTYVLSRDEESSKRLSDIYQSFTDNCAVEPDIGIRTPHVYFLPIDRAIKWSLSSMLESNIVFMDYSKYIETLSPFVNTYRELKKIRNITTVYNFVDIGNWEATSLMLNKYNENPDNVYFNKVLAEDIFEDPEAYYKEQSKLFGYENHRQFLRECKLEHMILSCN